MKIRVMLLVALSPTFGFANAGAYTSGPKSNGALGTFHGENVDSIEMRAEDLRIDLHIESGHIEVEYTLHNPGDAVVVESGFPCTTLVPVGSDEGGEKKKRAAKATPPLRHFTAELDAQKLECKVVAEETAPEDASPVPPTAPDSFRAVPYWYTFKLPFAKGQSRTLRMRYDTDYYFQETFVSEDGQAAPETLTYLFSTAAIWKGPIGKGKVTINAIGVPADNVQLNLPKRFHRKGNVWTWTFKNFEPGLADDLVISTWPAQETFPRSIAKTDSDDEGPRGNFVHGENRWQLEHRDFAVTATSTLDPTINGAGTVSYEADNLIAAARDLCWAEGAQGDGVGEGLTLNLRVPRRVSHLAIRNGYVKSGVEALYYQNGRVAEFAVSINGGKPFTASIPDERLARRFYLLPLPSDTGDVKTIELTIQKTYPGTAGEDTCISAIHLVTPLAKDPKVKPAR
jgi:hypothetical protein